MKSLSFLRTGDRTRTTTPHISQSSRLPEPEEFDDDLTLAEDAKLLSETSSLSSPFTRSRNPRRTVSYQRVSTTLLLIATVALSSLVTYAFVTQDTHVRHGNVSLTNDGKAVVLASYRDQDVSWLKDLSPE